MKNPIPELIRLSPIIKETNELEAPIYYIRVATESGVPALKIDPRRKDLFQSRLSLLITKYLKNNPYIIVIANKPGQVNKKIFLNSLLNILKSLLYADSKTSTGIKIMSAVYGFIYLNTIEHIPIIPKFSLNKPKKKPITIKKT